MKLLVLDTCLEPCQAAVFVEGAPAAIASEPMSRGHQERLGPMTREVMAAACLSFSDLDRIGVTIGPGSFTGLRVGIAFAKGLALAANVPVVGVGTLPALVASDPTPGLKTAVMDAGRGGLWLERFDGETSLGPARNVLLEDAELASAGRLIGPTASKLASPGQATLDLAAPSAAALAHLAAVAQLGPVHPLYLRPPDAKPKAR